MNETEPNTYAETTQGIWLYSVQLRGKVGGVPRLERRHRPGARIVATTDAYAMRGQLASSTVSGGYLLNSDGNAFEQNTSGSVGAFRAYFVSKMAADIAPKTLKVRIGGETTGIALAKTTARGDGAWYTLQGLRLNGKPTAPGLYIHGGGKVAVK